MKVKLITLSLLLMPLNALAQSAQIPKVCITDTGRCILFYAYENQKLKERIVIYKNQLETINKYKENLYPQNENYNKSYNKDLPPQN